MVTTGTGRQYNFTDPQSSVFLVMPYWMGSLSFNLIGTEQLTFTNYVWGANNAYMNITIKNTGSNDLSIQDVRLDGNSVGNNLDPAPYPLAKGTAVTIIITPTTAFSHSVQYEFTVITAKGNIFGPYIKTAP